MTYTGIASKSRFNGAVMSIRTLHDGPGRELIVDVAQQLATDLFDGVTRERETERIAAATEGGVVSRVIVLRSGNELREIMVALPYGQTDHERTARDFMKWSTGRDWMQIGAFGNEERSGAPSIRVATYYTMSGSK